MTDEEVARFALQLREAERIRALIASEEATLAHGRSDEPSRDAMPLDEHPSTLVMATAA